MKGIKQKDYIRKVKAVSTGANALDTDLIIVDCNFCHFQLSESQYNDLGRPTVGDELEISINKEVEK